MSDPDEGIGGDTPQMIRKLQPGKLVIASHNPGKVREIRALLGPYGIEPVSAAELDLPEPEETGVTFVANAELKALQAADLSGLPALADDSGLCVEALNGDPGIFSARWAGETKDFGIAMQRVEDKLAALPPRPAATRISSARSHWPGPTGMSNGSRAAPTACWSGRRAAITASATIRSSCPTATTSPMARWTPRPSTR